MTAVIDKLLELEVDKQAAIDNEVEDKQQETSDLLYSLATREDDRDAELWAYLGVDPSLTMPDYFMVPANDRDETWRLGLESLLAASLRQAFIEIYGIEFLESAERRNNRIAAQAGRMSPADVRQAGKQGFGKKQITDARQKRRDTR